jgi:hypothetical protein
MFLKEKLNRKQRFDLLFRFIANRNNLDFRRYSDVPFIIVPYEIEEENKIDTPLVLSHLDKNDIRHLYINLYQLSLELLDNNLGDLDHLLDIESKQNKNRFLEDLQNLLDSEKIADSIFNKSEEVDAQLVLISGVGEVFPYIRLSKLLTHLATRIKEKVLLVFFPGTYEQSDEKGTYLRLFGDMDYDHHYRAFNIEDLNL